MSVDDTAALAAESSPSFVDTWELGRLLLIRRRRHVSQRRMQSPVVVEGHVVAELRCDFVIMCEMKAMHNVALHRVEEGLDVHVVVHLSRPIHALHDATPCQAC